MKSNKVNDIIGLWSLRIAALIIVAIFLILIYDIFSKGYSVLSFEFLFSMPKKGMTEGGIWPAIMGTFLVTLVTTLFSIPIGISAAIYLNEYARDNWLNSLIRAAIRNLAGVPSIVYGIFGLALFVKALNFGTSVLSAGLTLGLLTLPWVITTSEEALKSVPDSFREGSLALGATQWQTIWHNVLPLAMPGIITGGILGLSRAAGETAPILFTGAVFFLPKIPGSLFEQFMSLPYHLYILSTQHQDIQQVRPIAYGTALVLIGLVFLLNLVAFYFRNRLQQKTSK